MLKARKTHPLSKVTHVLVAPLDGTAPLRVNDMPDALLALTFNRWIKYPISRSRKPGVRAVKDNFQAAKL